MTFPKNVGQIPICYNHKNTGKSKLPASQNHVFWSHYIDESNDPLYVFGHGSSYTSFEYKHLKLSSNNFNETSTITATFTLTNTGKYGGKEVVKMYIRDLFGSITRPVKELKDFKMVSLKPGESKEISFTIDTKTTQFYTVNNKWESDLGDFKLFIGGSSKTSLEADFSFNN